MTHREQPPPVARPATAVPSRWMLQRRSLPPRYTITSGRTHTCTPPTPAMPHSHAAARTLLTVGAVAHGRGGVDEEHDVNGVAAHTSRALNFGPEQLRFVAALPLQGGAHGLHAGVQLYAERDERKEQLHGAHVARVEDVKAARSAHAVERISAARVKSSAHHEHVVAQLGVELRGR